MDPEVKLNNTGKVTAGSIVSFNYKGEQKTGIVYATNSSRDEYRVKHISNDPKKRGMIGTVELAGKDLWDRSVKKVWIKLKSIENVCDKVFFIKDYW